MRVELDFKNSLVSVHGLPLRILEAIEWPDGIRVMLAWPNVDDSVCVIPLVNFEDDPSIKSTDRASTKSRILRAIVEAIERVEKPVENTVENTPLVQGEIDSASGMTSTAWHKKTGNLNENSKSSRGETAEKNRRENSGAGGNGTPEGASQARSAKRERDAARRANQIELIRGLMAITPNISVKTLAAKLGVSQPTVRSLLAQEKKA